MEEWRDIVGFEGVYQVSNLGRVKSLNYRHTGKEKILKANKLKFGYLQVMLYKNGKGKYFKIHRLVATMFLENPLNKPLINHIDCNPQNNCVNNLEWCTQKENMQYAYKLGRMKGTDIGKKRSKPLIAINLTTGEEIYFESQNEAARQLNLNQRHINDVLKSRCKKHKGYTFKYLKED